MRIISGQSGGLFFRVNTDFFNEYAGYLFEINSAGMYRISTSQRFNVSLTPLQNWTVSSALLRGNTASNMLQVIARGSSLFFYANGVYLTRLTDANYTLGVIAFLAASDGRIRTEVVYSNLRVYALS